MNLALVLLLISWLGVASAESRLDDVSFDETEDDPNELESTRYEPSDNEPAPNNAEDNRAPDGVHTALLAAMRRPGMQKKLGEIMPIIRVMSPPQRLTLAALLTSQMLNVNAPTLNEVSAMFGVEPSAPDDVKRRVTSALLLPISYDIARLLKGDRAQRRIGPGHTVLPSWPPGGDRPNLARRRPVANRRMSHVYAEMVPPPPPIDRKSVDQKQVFAERRSDIVNPADRKEEVKCLFFSSTVCLEVPDYPGAQIAASLRAASDAMDNALLPGSGDLEQTLGENRRQDNGVDTAAMCDSTTKMARPKRARTTSGQWKFIVNTGHHTQTLRLEVCSKVKTGCSYISDNFASECTQVFNYHRLLAWDEERGLHMDIFKVPTCCSCQVRGYANSFPPTTSSGHAFLGHASDSHAFLGHASDSHAFESNAPGRVVVAPSGSLQNNEHGNHETFILQGSPFQDAFEALPADETELLKQGAVIEQQLFDRQREQATQRRGQRRPGVIGQLPLGLLPPPGPPSGPHPGPHPGPTRPRLEFVDNNIRRSRNQTESESRYQHVGVSRLPAIPLKRPSQPEPITSEQRPVTTPTTPATTPSGRPHNRNAPQFEPESTKVNYNYHPIIDFFKSRKIEARSGEGWTPILGSPAH